jgi:hypothetical protein
MRFVKRFFIYLFIDIKKSLDYLMVKPKDRSLINSFSDILGIEIVSRWRIGRIISSELNPLKYCLPAITLRFAQLARFELD